MYGCCAVYVKDDHLLELSDLKSNHVELEMGSFLVEINKLNSFNSHEQGFEVSRACQRLSNNIIHSLKYSNLLCLWLIS